MVDNESTDGSWEVLQSMRSLGVKAIRKRCSRGAAREAAILNSAGRIVLSHMDCDDVFSADGLLNLLSIYNSRAEGRMMMTRRTGQDERSNITIAPRELIEEVGGWRDINWGEDWDLWNRVAQIGKYLYLPYPGESPPHERIKLRRERETESWSKFLTRYSKFHDSIRIGRPVFSQEERVSTGQWFSYWLARLSVGISRKRLEHVPLPDFDDTLPQVQ